MEKVISDVIIRAFRAIDDEASCIRYLEGHRRVLIEHGFSHFKTNTQDWFYNPNIYVLIAEDCRTNDCVGGVRLEIADDSYELPTQKALKKIEPRIVEYIALHQKDGLAECCGLWNSKSYAGKKISVLLVRAATAYCSKLGINKLLAFLASYTAYISQRMGYESVKTLGNNGDFNYPNDNFIARVHLIKDVNTLDYAAELDKERIVELRKTPNKLIEENETKTPLIVQYLLNPNEQQTN